MKSKKSKRLKFFLHPLFLIIMHLWMFEISKPVFHISVLPEFLNTPIFELFALQVFGSIVTFISLGFLIATLYSFRNSLRFGMHSNNLGKLVTNGVFSITRNPFFISIELFFIGIALIIPSPFVLGFALFAIIGVHFFILKEEKFMLENYGEEYKNYMKKVRRYL